MPPKKKLIDVDDVNVKKTDNAVCVYDFTLFDDVTYPDINSTLKLYCKKWAFQKEKCPKTDKHHWQGRFSLIQKMYKATIIRTLSQYWEKFNISVTSAKCHSNSDYVMKTESRIEGPYTHLTADIPRDLLVVKELYPWQQTLKDRLNVYDLRIIDVIVDPKGNTGKTTFCRYMAFFENAALLPYCNDFKDVMQMAKCCGPCKVYLIDMPRAITKEKLKGFYSGVEQLKSGYMFDTRYKFESKMFAPPRIAIFTNKPPKKSYLSNDRWRIWTIRNNKLESCHRSKIYYNNEFLDSSVEDDEIAINDMKYRILKDPIYRRHLHDLLAEKTNPDLSLS